MSSEMEAAINQAQEAMAKQLRLRKQQKLLKTRGAEMLRRGLQSLDELEEIEEKERKERGDRAGSASANADDPVPSCEDASLDLLSMSPS